jgi:hypothetical protein
MVQFSKVPLLLRSRSQVTELGRKISTRTFSYLVKVAVQVVAALTVRAPSTQSMLPLQPAKVEFAAGEGVRTITRGCRRARVRVIDGMVA